MSVIVPPSYRVLVRRADRTLLGELTRWRDLTMIPRFNDVGTWTLTASLEDSVARGLLALVLNSPSDVGVVVTRDNRTVISGPVNEVKEVIGGGEQGRGALQLNGFSDEQILAERVAYQDPTSSAIDQTAQAFHAVAGPAETVLHTYVRANAGPTALSYRRVTGLQFAADEARGGTVAERARMDPLLALAQRIALTSDLGFRVSHDLDADGLVFSVYDPEDKTASVVLSRALGTLTGYERTITRPQTTALIVGGNGDGVARVFGEAVNATIQGRWGRVEDFHDRSDAAALADLTDAGDTELREASEQQAVTVSIRDTPGVQFGRDYQLGDRVSVTLDDGSTFQQVIREMELRVGETGRSQANENTKGRTERVRILVGTPRTKLVKVGGKYQTRTIGLRVAGLERRR